MAWFEYPSAKTGTEGEVIGKRIVAFGIDVLLVVGAIAAVIAGLDAVEPPFLPGLKRFFGVVIGFGYFIVLEGEYGQTIGKMLTGIVVVTEAGEPIDYAKAAGRTFLRPVDGIFFAGLISMLATDRHQRPGDLSAETVVVRAVDPVEATDDQSPELGEGSSART